MFANIFDDRAMYNYNVTGYCNRYAKRKAMLNYQIFSDCMLGEQYTVWRYSDDRIPVLVTFLFFLVFADAWSKDGINEIVLCNKLQATIKKINGRKRNRKYFSKIRLQRHNALLHTRIDSKMSKN